MFSFWPSVSLLIFFLIVFLECRAIAGRVTLPLGSFLTVFCYGCIGAPLLALLVQQLPLAFAGESEFATWLVGPPIEELAKALPVIVLAFLTRESRRLSIADLTLIGFASGAGFGFVEGNLNAMVTGALPGFQHLAALGLQSASSPTADAIVYFAGHPVSTALVGLAAGIGLRFLPPNMIYAWVPAAWVLAWVSFDHGVYNWKVLQATEGGLPQAHVIVEFLHGLTLHGQLATSVLVSGLITAQLIEAFLCSRAVGPRRDLLLASEWRPWIVNEWLVALLRVPVGRAAFGQTLAYFRLRRAFYLAAYEARRDPNDPTLSRHARSLEERLKRERSVLFTPPYGSWLLPLPVLQRYAMQWTWRMRWVLLFAVLLLLLFLLDPASLPTALRQFLFGEMFTSSVLVAGAAFAVWRIILFGRQPRPDPLAAEGTAFTSYYTRQLLLGCALVCALFPTLAPLFGWKAFATGAAFIGGYLPAWIAQGGNLQALLALGVFGSAVAPDPRPVGEALRHEIAAADERMRRLGADIQDKVGVASGDAFAAAAPLELDAFLETMVELDSERDAQTRRQFVLDEYERHASEATIKNPTAAVQAVKDEFDRLAGELLEAAGKELDAIAALERAYGKAWSEIMRTLDDHDASRRTLTASLRQAWQTQNDLAWALRVAGSTDECLLPTQLMLLPELEAAAITTRGANAGLLAAGIERICTAASAFGEVDPLAFVSDGKVTPDSEVRSPRDLGTTVTSHDAPKAFGQRTSGDASIPTTAADEVKADVEPLEAAPTSASHGTHYQEALDQLIEATKRDKGYLDTITQLERSGESLPQADVPEDAEPQTKAERRKADRRRTERRRTDSSPDEPASAAPPQRDHVEPDTHKPEAKPESSRTPDSEPSGGLDALIDAIKRDSGYLNFSKDPPSTPVKGLREAPTPAARAPVAARGAIEPESPSVPTVATPELEKDDIAPAPEAEPVSIPTAEEPVERIAAEQIGAPAVVEPLGQPAVEEIAPAAEVEQVGAQTAEEPAEQPAVEEIAPAAEVEQVGAQTAEEPAEQPLAERLDLATDEITPAPEAEALSVQTAAEQIAPAPAPEPDVVATAPLQKEEEAADTTAQAADHVLPSPAVDDGTPLPRGPESTASTETPADVSAKVEHAERAEAAAPASVETKKPRAPYRAAAETDGPSTSFARGFRKKRTLDVPSTPPADELQAPAPSTAEPTDAKPAAAANLGDAATAAPAQSAPEPEKVSDTAAAPIKTESWLADLAPAKAEDASPTARTGDARLQPIEWPAQKQTADESVTAPTPTPEAATADVEIAPALESSTPAVDSRASEVGVADPQPKGLEQAAGPAPAEVTQPEPSQTLEDRAVQPETSPGVQKFSSKADRLSYLLAKLEGAMDAQTESAARPARSDAAAAPPAAAPEVLRSGPQAPRELPTRPVEAPAKVDTSPEPDLGVPSKARSAGVTDRLVADQHQDPAEDHKSDRLSHLLTKLFTAVKQEPAEPPEGPKESDPLPSLDTATPSTARADGPPAPESADARQSDPGRAPTAQASPEPKGAIDPKPVEAREAPKPVEPQPHAEAQPPPEPAPKRAIDPKPVEVREPSKPVEPKPVAKQAEVVPKAAGTPQRDASAQPIAEQPRAVIPPAPVAAPSTPEPAPPAEATETEPELEEHSPQPVPEAPMTTTPRRDWKLGGGHPAPGRDARAYPRERAPAAHANGETPKSPHSRRADPREGADAANKAEAGLRVKLQGSRVLATADDASAALSAAAAGVPKQGKYYGPRHANSDEETSLNAPAQQRAVNLADAVNAYYAKTGQPQPPMHTTDRASLQRAIVAGKLEAPRRRGAPWSTSGMLRRGEVVIRLKPGAEKFVELVPSKEIFGQVPHYYSRGVGKGNYATYVPTTYLEHFDLAAGEWTPLERA